MWTRVKLMGAMRRLIQRLDTTIQQTALQNDYAHTTWERRGEIITIHIDLHRDGYLRAVFHELIHIVCETSLKEYDSRLEEWCVNGMEDGLWLYIESHPHQLTWWRKAINRRIVKGRKQ